MFSFEYCEIFKNTYFEEHLQTTASAELIQSLCIYQAKYLELLEPCVGYKYLIRLLFPFFLSYHKTVDSEPTTIYAEV